VRTNVLRSSFAAPLVALVVLAGGGTAALLVTSATSAGAATFTVTNTLDAGAGSLRQAFVDATTADADSTITVDPALVGHSIALTTGELFFNPGGGTASLAVQGNGVIVNQGTSNARVFRDSSTGLFSIDNVKITGGNLTATPANGVAVLAARSLSITNSEITANTATSTSTTNTAADIIHQGASSADTLTLSGTNIHGNTATGTGVGNSDGIVWSYTTNVVSSTIADNIAQATGSGDSIGIFDSTNTTFAGTTVTGNQVLANTGRADGIFDSNNVTLTGSTVSGNTNGSSSGGPAYGIFNSSTTDLTGSTVDGNTNSSTSGGAAYGILDTGNVTLTDSAVTNNTNSANSGTAYGIFDSNDTTITRSTVSGNTNSAGSGTAFGGINVGLRSLSVVNSTVSNNVASGETTFGGGIYQGSSIVGAAQDAGENPRHSDRAARRGVNDAAAVPTLTLVYSTVVDNTAATGANIASVATASSFGTVVALPQVGVNCVLTGLPLTSHGWNFSDDTTCGFTNTTSGDKQAAGNPQLGALAANGGPGPTRLPNDGHHDRRTRYHTTATHSLRHRRSRGTSAADTVADTITQRPDHSTQVHRVAVSHPARPTLTLSWTPN
jgi:hypothetical protein